MRARIGVKKPPRGVVGGGCVSVLLLRFFFLAVFVGAVSVPSKCTTRYGTDFALSLKTRAAVIFSNCAWMPLVMRFDSWISAKRSKNTLVVPSRRNLCSASSKTFLFACFARLCAISRTSVVSAGSIDGWLMFCCLLCLPFFGAIHNCCDSADNMGGYFRFPHNAGD